MLCLAFSPVGQNAFAAGQTARRERWWKSLRDAIRNLDLSIACSTADRYAEYLAGFILICEGQQERGTSAWRAFKRSKSLKEIGIVAAESVSAKLARKEHLKTVLCKLKADDAVAAGWKAYLVPARVLKPVWAWS